MRSVLFDAIKSFNTYIIGKDDAILHSFPNPQKDMDGYETWIQAAGINLSLEPDYVYKSRRVCHAHFETKYHTWTRS